MGQIFWIAIDYVFGIFRVNVLNKPVSIIFKDLIDWSFKLLKLNMKQINQYYINNYFYSNR